MTEPQLINYLLLLCSGALGWFVRELWGAVKALRADLAKLKDHISENYTRKDDFKDFRTELLGYLQRIEQKLDSKQDK